MSYNIESAVLAVKLSAEMQVHVSSLAWHVMMFIDPPLAQSFTCS